MAISKNIKRLFITLIIVFISLYTNTSYAALKNLTDEDLNASLQKMANSEYNDGNYTISVANKVITIRSTEKSYNIGYNLTGSPTFTLEIPIEKGMSYETFINETDNVILPVIGYIAMSDMQGIRLEDTTAYIMFSYLENRLSGALSNKSSYEIVDDLKEGSEVEKTEDPKIIYTSEFGEKVLEYVKDLYKERQTMSDRTGFNTYEMTIELEETENSSKIVSKLTIKSDADFSKLEGYSNDSNGEMSGGTGESTPGGINNGNNEGKGPITGQPGNQGSGEAQPDNDNTVANTILPRTGSISLIIIISIISALAVILYINNKRYKDIK